MSHPFEALLESRPEPAAKPPGAVVPQPPGGLGPVDEDEGDEPSVGASPGSSLSGIPERHILAVQDGPGGYIHFPPDTSPATRREIADNLAWFDRSDARRTRLGNAVCAGWLPRAKVGPFTLTRPPQPGKVPAKEHPR